MPDITIDIIELPKLPVSMSLDNWFLKFSVTVFCSMPYEILVFCILSFITVLLMSFQLL